MKICIISSTSHLQKFSVLGDLEMCLAPLVSKEETKTLWPSYASYYKEQAQKGRFVIFDNGAFELEKELGAGFGPKHVFDLARDINPHELICTDILFDKYKTLEATKEFIGTYNTLLNNGTFCPLTRYEDDEREYHQVRLMGVPQGKTIEEWFDCYEKMLNIKALDTIGLSKISVPQCFNGSREEIGAITKGRIMCTSEIVARGLEPDKFGKVVHLLGSDAWMGYEVRVQSQYSWIRSIDSSAPVHYGLNGKDMDETTGRFDCMLTDKPDLGNEKAETDHCCDKEMSKIYRNIAIVQKFAKGF